MTDYTELVKALRCKRDDCEGCDLAFFDKDEGWMCQYAAKDDDAAAAIEALQAQLPKRGEWIWDDKRCIYVCSVCGSPKVRENMDRQIIREQAYCYSCGAKMTGEQDVE